MIDLARSNLRNPAVDLTWLFSRVRAAWCARSYRAARPSRPVVGVAAATSGQGRATKGWRRRTGLVAAAELTLLAGVVAGWVTSDGRPQGSVASLLLGLAAAAMGVQSVVTINSGCREPRPPA